MHKLFLLALLLSGATPVLAQTTPAVAHPLAVQYCTLVARGTHYGTLAFHLDYGLNGAGYTGISADQQAADNVKVRELFTVADALNFLSSKGWEVVGISTLTGDIVAPDTTPSIRSGSILGTFRSEVQYLLRRRGQ
ncbi:hypothetical protein [Hymenobacter negativus]|uniref:PASTA domain-containing protein n=1 Tax=Hymenobacter negativus TaxID=2795026 RepID=A0ABS3QC58_9BACT|nr:hypothetical protein [Hymenobacter negativus]MBO2008818.1 hypothetical protein [Hymenobacter negativus]